jgi:hypothetical protein
MYAAPVCNPLASRSPDAPTIENELLVATDVPKLSCPLVPYKFGSSFVTNNSNATGKSDVAGGGVIVVDPFSIDILLAAILFIFIAIFYGLLWLILYCIYRYL